MQLTHYTDYSLRVLIFLSLQKDGQRVTIGDIATHFAIPRTHLMKVVQRLGQLGYVQTLRGKGGGLRLGMSAGAIRLGAVVRDMEARLDIIDCAQPPCPLNNQCLLKSLLDEAAEAFLTVLDGYTLADLRTQPKRLQNLLRWHPPAAD